MPSNQVVDLNGTAVVSVQFFLRSADVPERIFRRTKQGSIANPNPNRIPAAVRREQGLGKCEDRGTQIMNHVPGVILQETIGKVLKAEGFPMVNVYTNQSGGEMCSVQFNFRPFDPKNPGFDEIRNEAEKFFSDLCHDSSWSTDIWENRFFDAGAPTELSAIQVRCQNRNTHPKVSNNKELIATGGKLRTI